MHPDLMNNPTFLGYHDTWQRDPTSSVFAPLADFFCQYKLYADARKICEAAVRNNPNSVLAHYSLAKAYLCTREWHSARHEAQWVLARNSDHHGALDVLRQIEQHQVPVRHIMVQPESVQAKPVEVAVPVETPAPVKEIVKAMEQAGGSSVPKAVAPEKAKKLMPWQTVTMAKIYSQQGLFFKARTIYKTILSRDPQNTEAQAGLATLERTMRDAAA